MPSITFLQHHADEGRIYIHRRGYPGKQYLFLDNEPLLYGLSTVTGYESEVPRSFYPELLRISDTFPHPKALGFLGVSYLVFYPGLIPSGTLPMADSSSMAIYANPFARPRAALYYRKSILANDSVILDRIFDENDPHDCVWFTTTEDAPSLDSTPAPEWEPAAIVRSSENEVDLKTNASRSAYLVLTDSYYPGWNCFVDGKPQKIYRCNFNMRAVLLSAGAHHVAFIFWPYTAVIGGWCSFCTVLFLVLGSLGVYWRRKSFFGHE
ncbi:MAG TPA: YfhO family protein [Candidatus Kapabacteria bacterium]